MRQKGQRAAAAKRGKAPSTAKTVPAEALPISGPPQNIDDAITLAAWAMHAVLTGTIDPRTAQMAAKLVDSFRASLRERDHLQEVARLKEQLRALKQRTSLSSQPD